MSPRVLATSRLSFLSPRQRRELGAHAATLRWREEAPNLGRHAVCSDAGVSHPNAGTVGPHSVPRSKRTYPNGARDTCGI